MGRSFQARPLKRGLGGALAATGTAPQSRDPKKGLGRVFAALGRAPCTEPTGTGLLPGGGYTPAPFTTEEPRELTAADWEKRETAMTLDSGL